MELISDSFRALFHTPNTKPGTRNSLMVIFLGVFFPCCSSCLQWEGNTHHTYSWTCDIHLDSYPRVGNAVLHFSCISEHWYLLVLDSNLWTTGPWSAENQLCEHPWLDRPATPLPTPTQTISWAALTQATRGDISLGFTIQEGWEETSRTVQGNILFKEAQAKTPWEQCCL